MKEFKVGDRVRFAKHPGNGYWGATIGDIGTIRAIDSTGNNTWYAVEFDTKRAEYTDCNGKCKSYNGWWCLAVSLEHYADKATEERRCKDRIALNVKQLSNAGWKTEDIIKAVEEVLKGQLCVGSYVKVADTACLYTHSNTKVRCLASRFGAKRMKS